MNDGTFDRFWRTRHDEQDNPADADEDMDMMDNGNVQPNEVAQTNQINEEQVIQDIRNLLRECERYEETQQDAPKRSAKKEILKKLNSGIKFYSENGDEERGRDLVVAYVYSACDLPLEAAKEFGDSFGFHTLTKNNKYLQCRKCDSVIKSRTLSIAHWRYGCDHNTWPVNDDDAVNDQQMEREDEEDERPNMRRQTRGRRDPGQELPGGSDTESQETDEEETELMEVELSKVSRM
jgi:hypothetical protein